MSFYPTTAESRYQRLQTYLKEGWSIHPPVFMNPSWSYTHHISAAYHFILERNSSHQLLVVPRSPKVDHFISERQLQLNRL